MAEIDQRSIRTFLEEKKFVTSLGGSVLFGEFKDCEANSLIEFDEVFVPAIIEFLNSLAQQEFSTAVIVGGGGVARARMEDIRKFGGDHDGSDIQLDFIGIEVSDVNATSLLSVLLRHGMPGAKLKRKQKEFKPGQIYVRGGTEPGRTTDFVAVETAIKMGSSVVVNISNTPGLHPVLEDGELDKSKIIEKLPLQEYLDNFSVEHKPGVNTPFDSKAAQLALDNGITVILVGSDLENIKKLQAGEEFSGTVLN